MAGEVLANVWVADDQGEYWFEGEPARLQATAEDGVVRVGVMVDGRDQEVFGAYMSPATAKELLVGLGAAIQSLEE